MAARKNTIVDGRLTTIFPPIEFELIFNEADKRGVSMGAVVRWAVNEYFERRKGENK